MRFLSIIAGVLAVANATPMHNATIPNDGTSPGFRVIPFSKIGCWEDKLNLGDVRIAKEKLIEWGREYPIPAGKWAGRHSHLAAVWICNCKHFYKDRVDAAEVNEAQALIRDYCGGPTASGWVWSRQWQKSWNFLSLGQW
ncbi:hypothetical protein ONZ43_g1302 [Nemania bipapillata]|uniref:Uncharacterized protein n=1 Tax=Nemania bipapillata TaxID=110536 RepID=A0ACC2J546_9PEZI|nr:hypothetical protein ONZ43_g1302 [Nemania bipapillata]